MQAGRPIKMVTSVTFNPDYTCVQKLTGKRGTWELAASELKVSWNDDTWNRMTLSADGKTLEGKNYIDLKCRAVKKS